MYVPTWMTDLNVGANVRTGLSPKIPSSETLMSPVYDPADATNILQAAVQSINSTDENVKMNQMIKTVSDEDNSINIQKKHEFKIKPTNDKTH